MPIEFDSSTKAGASASQGRAKRGRASARRTLDRPQQSAGYDHALENPPVDFGHLKGVVSLAMILSRYGILSGLKNSAANSPAAARSTMAAIRVSSSSISPVATGTASAIAIEADRFSNS